MLACNFFLTAVAASWTRAGLDRLLTLQTVFRLRTADAILPEDWSVIDKGQLELWHEVIMEPATACHRGVEHIWHEQWHTHRNVRLLQVQNLVRVRQKPTDEFDIMVSHQHYATQHTSNKLMHLLFIYHFKATSQHVPSDPLFIPCSVYFPLLFTTDIALIIFFLCAYQAKETKQKCAA